jgi:hypothetical protein
VRKIINVRRTHDDACEQHAQRARTARDDLRCDALTMASDTSAHGGGGGRRGVDGGGGVDERRRSPVDTLRASERECVH